MKSTTLLLVIPVFLTACKLADGKWPDDHGKRRARTVTINNAGATPLHVKAEFYSALFENDCDQSGETKDAVLEADKSITLSVGSRCYYTHDLRWSVHVRNGFGQTHNYQLLNDHQVLICAENGCTPQ